MSAVLLFKNVGKLVHDPKESGRTTAVNNVIVHHDGAQGTERRTKAPVADDAYTPVPAHTVRTH